MKIKRMKIKTTYNLNKLKFIKWSLRIAVFGLFLGHGSPAIGRLKAVTNAQSVAQISIMRNGLIRIIKATKISIMPIIGKRVVAVA